MRSFYLILFFFLFLVSCSENAGSESSTKAPAVVKLTIRGNDQMQFDKKELRVKEGQQVELTLIHSGKMAKEVMGHNFILLQAGSDVNAFGQAALEAKETDYIPESDLIIVHTKLLGGGQKEVITFAAPAKGSYPFLCSFPGHVALMNGQFIVE